MKKKMVMAFLLCGVMTVSFVGCGSKAKKEDIPVTDTKEDQKAKMTVDDIEEVEIQEATPYTAVLGDYTVTFDAEKGFVQDEEEQMPEESRKLGARAIKYTNSNGDEIFLSYSPEEMTPNIGNATNAEEYMSLEDDGTTSKWAEDVEAGNWKGFHFKATTAGSNQVGYDLYHDGQEIKISVSSIAQEKYPMLENLNITGESKMSEETNGESSSEDVNSESTENGNEKSGEQDTAESDESDGNSNGQNADSSDEGDPEEVSEEAPDGAGNPDDYAEEDGE